MNASGDYDTGWVGGSGNISLSSTDGSGYSLISNLQSDTFDNSGNSVGGIFMDNTSYIYTSGNGQGIPFAVLSRGGAEIDVSSQNARLAINVSLVNSSGETITFTADSGAVQVVNN